MFFESRDCCSGGVAIDSFVWVSLQSTVLFDAEETRPVSVIVDANVGIAKAEAEVVVVVVRGE